MDGCGWGGKTRPTLPCVCQISPNYRLETNRSLELRESWWLGVGECEEKENRKNKKSIVNAVQMKNDTLFSEVSKAGKWGIEKLVD